VRLSRDLIRFIETKLINLFHWFLPSPDKRSKLNFVKHFAGWNGEEAAYFMNHISTPALYSRHDDEYWVLSLEYQSRILTGDESEFDPREIRCKVMGASHSLVLKYITVRFFKNGTMRVVFNNPRVLHCFNIYWLRHFKMLPPRYGEVPYKKLTKPERSVIDAFEGEACYSEVYENRTLYLTDISQLPFLQPLALQGDFAIKAEKYSGLYRPH
jgi:hypothetical protein